jgi:UDP-N-acetylglucosamine 2-epimerase (non-hydrolysing)
VQGIRDRLRLVVIVQGGVVSTIPKILVVFGTRPEAIKMAPVVIALAESRLLEHRVCATSQHREMLRSVLDLFSLKPDYDLDVMRPGQDLSALSARLFSSLSNVLSDYRPDLVMVHGDTTSAFVAAMSAFYSHIPVAHVEAGLRTRDKYAPFPEEVNRQFIDRLADYLFVPTAGARANLAAEGIDDAHVFLTGNTIVDAVTRIVGMNAAAATALPAQLAGLGGRFILVTGHRRENFGEGFESICEALREIAAAHPAVQVVYPVHLNPHVQEPVRRILGGAPNIMLTDPLDYGQFVTLMSRCDFLISDSGGVQEEACVLKKPVLLMREVTERPEAVEAGFVKLVGTDKVRIVEGANGLLRDPALHAAMTSGANPYGDGTASAKIVRILEEGLGA